ncbi:MAG TPA: M20 family metallopeptidase [Gammaproteobacteria bacterium]|jgi:acetylornithine deacetylase/succinyl-diaminopimelate desuccinylase-like protein|nr:M20 family metallopeptidase [Gammaproteobacteria bacterium]
MDQKELKRFVDETWDESILPTLQTYIGIPNKSPGFDPKWQEHGHMDRAIELAAAWCRQQPIRGMSVEIMRLPGRTPLLFAEIPGDGKDTVLLYGHLDKQPEFTGWMEGLDPWKPVMRGDKLYGRGGADDGYATFASLTAIRALQEQGIPHARCVMVIECCEESGSYDLPHHIEALGKRLGDVSLVVCLDAECGNYDQLWTTTSLRGNLVGTLTVEVLTEGVHSGAASGIVPSSFRVLRTLLDRVEDSASGVSKVKSLKPKIPAQRMQQIRRVAKVLKNTVYTKMPFAKGVQPISRETLKLIINNTWGPTLSVTGAEGIPALGNAGNVLRPQTTLKLSFRLPPTADAKKVGAEVRRILETKPPYGARVTFKVDSAMGGWNASPVAKWLEKSMQRSSKAHFGKDAVYMGTGGSIPFMGMLGKKFPKAQFLVTGLLGPKSNAHGPNEFLHVPTGKKLTACVAQVIADHHTRG